MSWFKYVKPYWPFFVLGPLCMIVEVIGEVLMPRFLAQVINNAADKAPLFSVGISIGMVATALMMMAGGIGGAYFGAKAAVSFAGDLRSDVYRKIQSYSFANMERFSSASLVTRTTNDVVQLQNFVNMLLRMCLRSPGMMIGALIMAIRMSRSLSAVLAVSIPLLIVVILLLIRASFPRFTKMQKKVDALNARVQENVTNIRVVKSFVREDYEYERFSEANADLKQSGLSALRIMVFMSPIMTLVMNLTVIAVIAFGSRQVLDPSVDFAYGDLSAFITYVTQILSSLMMITMMLMTSSRALASAKRIREVLTEEPEISDTDAAFPEKRIERGSIEFKDVSFRYYKNSPECVLSDVSLTIPAGSVVGIIGSTGCGKSTLVSLIDRLYDVDEGQVLIDGVDVRDYSLQNLRDGIGMVLQNNVLFSGTIRDNLLWGDQNASEDEILAAAESAQAHKFVSGFKDGYETALGQGGSNVSGGQKQRLCIARALLKKPRILILDDSTSAVDTATEAEIRRAFREELSDATKIVIAQRISSVKDSDMIVVMNDGRITGVGTHEELLRDNVEYLEIYRSQTDRKEA